MKDGVAWTSYPWIISASIRSVVITIGHTNLHLIDEETSSKIAIATASGVEPVNIQGMAGRQNLHQNISSLVIVHGRLEGRIEPATV
jgi:hypothetical protein